MLFTLLNVFMVRVADVLPVFREQTGGACISLAHIVFWCVLAFVTGMTLGYRRGYARGIKDGNPFPLLRADSRLYARLKDLCE